MTCPFVHDLIHFSSSLLVISHPLDLRNVPSIPSLLFGLFQLVSNMLLLLNFKKNIWGEILKTILLDFLDCVLKEMSTARLLEVTVSEMLYHNNRFVSFSERSMSHCVLIGCSVAVRNQKVYFEATENRLSELSVSLVQSADCHLGDVWVLWKELRRWWDVKSLLWALSYVNKQSDWMSAWR